MDNTMYYNPIQEKAIQGKKEGEGILTIIEGNGNVREVRLRVFNKSRIWIGRSRENDVVIDNNIVSDRHGKIKIVNGKVYYADLGSMYGTYLEEMGKVSYLNKNPQYVLLTNGTALRIQRESQGGMQSILILYSNMQHSGVFKRYDLINDTHKGMVRRIMVGRGETNQIVLSHPAISRDHATIQMAELGMYEIIDNKSLNGILINGKPLKNKQTLVDKDVIQIMSTILIFTQKAIYYRNDVGGIELDVSNLNKFVGKNKKQILTNVNCHIDSNEFVAIIGGSGAGKTTFMNAISGFDKEIKGKVTCNGQDMLGCFSNLKCMIGYVPQQDIIYENLTLKKMLYYTAKLKMPRDTRVSEVRERIQAVLKMVELEKHQNTYIRKLSGGQKKRASIAVELLGDPKLFFLDEPSSGLDPGNEKNLMLTLSGLAKTEGKTIIMVTHTTQNLHLCDKIIILGTNGRICFAGTVEQAKMFFDTNDLVDVYNKTAEDPSLWANQFDKCMEGDFMKKEMEAKPVKEKNKTSSIHQLFILVTRYMELMKNDLQRLALVFLQPLIVAVLLSVVADEEVFHIYEGTKSILFAFSCAGIWIGLFNSIQEICKERVILKREYMSNLRLPVYVLSKFFVQAVVTFLQAVILNGLFTKLVGKPEKGILSSRADMEMFFVLWLTIMASMAIGFIVSALVKSGDKAMAMAPFILIVQLLFSGILFELNGISKAVSYLTISKWSVEGFGSIADLNGLDLKLQSEIPQIVHEFDTAYEFSRKNLLENMGVLITMVIFSAIACTLLLKNLSKDAR